MREAWEQGEGVGGKEVRKKAFNDRLRPFFVLFRQVWPIWKTCKRRGSAARKAPDLKNERKNGDFWLFFSKDEQKMSFYHSEKPIRRAMLCTFSEYFPTTI